MVGLHCGEMVYVTLGSKKSKGPDWRRRQEEKISSEILELKIGKKGRPRSVLAHVDRDLLS